MAKKKLQLSEIKVKSFITLVDQTEQKTAKGGYIHNDKRPAIIIDVDDRPSWTEYKTRVTNDNDVIKLFGGNRG